MNNLPALLWIEGLKALRSRLPLWTTLGSLFMPAAIAFLIFIARNPQVSQQLGLMSAKADLIAYSAADWAAYLTLFGQMLAAGGFFLFVLIVSWVFGREFSDGTVKDLLAVPAPRSAILLAKFILAAAWCAASVLLLYSFSLAIGAALRLPGASSGLLIQGSARVAVAAGLSILTVLPFALLASAGRGYLLPLGAAVLALMSANLAAVLGWGEFFPWTIPGLYAMGESSLPPVSYWIVALTGLAGVMGTIGWWQTADQSR
jgi:ABC-2 type transport system permease protein